MLFVEYNACKSRPCKNGATCIKDGIKYNCLCKGSYVGTNCEGESLLKYKSKSTSCM